MPKHYDAVAVISTDESGNYVAPGGGGASNPNGQATMANSAPVVIASNQSNVPVNNAQVAGTATSVNTGTVDAGTQRVTLATNVNAPVNNVQVGGVAVAVGSGVNGTGVQRVNIATDQVAFPVTANPPSGTGFTLESAATTNATLVKASAGSLYSVTISNVTAATIYVKFYNKASAPTVGTDTPIITVPVAASAIVALDYGSIGQRFSTGIAYAITAAAVKTDTAAVTVGAQVAGTYI